MRKLLPNLSRKSQPELEPSLPIKLDSTSNGEFEPVALSPEVQLTKALAMEQAEENARRLGLSRRQFLMTAGGTATTLLCMNNVLAGGGNGGGFFDVTPTMALDLDAAANRLQSDQFIFDIQTHYVNPDKVNRNFGRGFFPQANCGEPIPADCFSVDHYLKEVFMDSQTSMAVLSAVPAVPGDDPLSVEEAAATRELVDMTQGSGRLLIHGLVTPNIQTESQLEGMQRLAEELQVKAWKGYTHFGPNGVGWFLDDEIGIPFIERARDVGVKVICIHKGLSGNSLYGTCRDVGVVANMFPDVTFIIYHSGFESARGEGPYNPASPRSRGIDTLITSLLENGVPPNSNVYAEIGSTWRAVMTAPTRAAHVIGKLLKFVGRDRLVWGTDSIWYGSPQDQIEAFRAFQISEELQEEFGYPALTDEIKANVFGLNAAVPYGVNLDELAGRFRSDDIARLKAEYQENPQPSFSTYGPKTRREFFNFLRLQGDRPA